jgi:hypothetical protein
MLADYFFSNLGFNFTVGKLKKLMGVYKITIYFFSFGAYIFLLFTD